MEKEIEYSPTVDLRDYFASLAMQSILSKSIVKKHSILSKIRIFLGLEGYSIDFDVYMKKISKASYEMADAMIEEKNKKEKI